VNVQSFLGIVLFCLGFPDEAVAQSSAAIAEARMLSHPAPLVETVGLASLMLLLLREDAALDERSEEFVALAAGQGFTFCRAFGTICRGWVTVKKGDVAEGIRLLRGGIAAFRATGSEAWTPYYFGLLATACEIAGQIGEALTLLDDGLQIGEEQGGRWLEA